MSGAPDFDGGAFFPEVFASAGRLKPKEEMKICTPSFLELGNTEEEKSTFKSRRKRCQVFERRKLWRWVLRKRLGESDLNGKFTNAPHAIIPKVSTYLSCWINRGGKQKYIWSVLTVRVAFV
jgi:hypothetical protein